MKLKFTLKTLGCKVNQYEEQLLRENLARFGFQESSLEEADVFIVNSCTVTGKADAKTKKLIRRAKKENPNCKVLVTGCYAVLEEDIKTLKAIAEVDMVVPGGEKDTLPEVLESTFGKSSGLKTKEEVSGFSSHTRAFLKIQDGCNQKCSYCKVNIVRGPSRSREEKEIIQEVERLARSGYKEIVFTGICLGSWVGDAGRKLSDLLSVIEKIEGEFRVRLSSIEPNHIDEKLISVLASSRRICHHLHLPLQSGSDRILRSMKRRYNRDQFSEIVKSLRKSIPGVGITMDIIEGYPGESDEDFRETYSFLEKIRPSRLHVFRYSDRKGTLSYDMKDKVPKDVAMKRVGEVIGLGTKLQQEFAQHFINKRVTILVEELSGDNQFEGYTSEYVRVKLDASHGTEGDLIDIVPNRLDSASATLFAK